MKAHSVPTITEVCQYLDQLAPVRLAEDWDNVGLLAGDPAESATKIMTCLTITPSSAAEAIEQQANLIVSHHPLPFRPLKKLTTESTPSRLLWQLIRAGVAIYSPHTGFDSAAAGINQMLATRLGLQTPLPLKPIEGDVEGLGSGRMGDVRWETLGELVDHCKTELGQQGLHVVGASENTVQRVAIACGSGGSFLGDAISAGCDTLITGETTFHTCLEAESSGVNLILLGHFASERFALEVLAEKLNAQFSESEVWASNQESDPLRWA